MHEELCYLRSIKRMEFSFRKQIARLKEEGCHISRAHCGANMIFGMHSISFTINLAEAAERGKRGRRRKVRYIYIYIHTLTYDTDDYIRVK